MYSLISFPDSSIQSSHASPLYAKVARAVKAEDIPVLECDCIKADIPREECGFSISPLIKKRS
jgi:hypothetical protein